MRRAVLVTGGAGYIGSHACKALDRAGYLPVAYDDLSHGHAAAVKWGPLIAGDLNCREALDAAFAMHAVSGVMHFAALAEVAQSIADPAQYYHTNVAGTLNLLQAMRAHRVHAMVFSSSCAVYGVPEAVPIAETAALLPINPYGESKLVIERLLYWYELAYGMRTVALRYFNAAGADPDGEIGEAHEPESHLIPLVIDAALGRRGPIRVYGRDYPTPDGTAIRDYIHVQDLAEAHVLALRYLLEQGSSTPLNLGTGRGYSVLEVIGVVERVLSCRVPHETAPRRAGDPARLVAEAARARDLLQWRPHLSELETIVGTAAAWHAGHGSRGRCAVHRVARS